MLPYCYLPITVGSRSTNIDLGTCFPPPVSLKNVLKSSSPDPTVLSLGIWPSGWIPCSRQNSSQQELPIWTPAWPTWREITSRCRLRWPKKKGGNVYKTHRFTIAYYFYMKIKTYPKYGEKNKQFVINHLRKKKWSSKFWWSFAWKFYIFDISRIYHRTEQILCNKYNFNSSNFM